MILARFVLDMLWKAVCFMCCIICGFFLLQTRILGRERAAGSLLWATGFLRSPADKFSFTYGKHKTIIM